MNLTRRFFAPAFLPLFFTAAAVAADSPAPHIDRNGAAAQLIADGAPFLMLGGELHNSSSTGPEYMARVWPKMQALGLNTVLASVPWELVEPSEGNFDFTLVDDLLRGAREHQMRLVLLWFGSWKNGVSSYAPAWVKTDLAKYRRCQGSSNHNTKDILSPFCTANRDADARAFAALMRHLKKEDGRKHTVLMVQVENEVGIRPEPRDLSEDGEAAFRAQVPDELMKALAAARDRLVPEFRARWEKSGFRSAGNWSEVFGGDESAAEIFMAWHYASYIGAVARAGKAEYPLPMYVNAWLRGPDGKAGIYPSGGPVSHVLDVWRTAAPGIDLFAPDIYLPDFKAVCADYTQGGNPLFIPEASTDDGAIGRAFWAFGAHGALGFSPFGIEHLRDDHPLRDGYAILRQLVPMIAAARGTGRMTAVYRQNPSEEKPVDPVIVGDYRANVRFLTRDLPGDAPRYGLMIQTATNEIIVAGSGIEVNFSATTPGPRQTHILRIDQGRFESGKWIRELSLNGDETGANFVAKIPPNASNSFSEPRHPVILKVTLYRHD